LSSAAYGLLYDSIGWRGLLLIGVLPALVIERPWPGARTIVDEHGRSYFLR
jgi:hypothetical protein